MAAPTGVDLGARYADPALAPVYEATMAPAIFTPWAERLVEFAVLQPGERVLDVATGTGAVARVAAARTGPGGHVTGVDMSEPMLAIARNKPDDPGAALIEYFEAPADSLPVPDGAFDVALCQQGLQYFPDPRAALREMRRALKPGGRLALAVWDTTAGTAACYRGVGLALHALGVRLPIDPPPSEDSLRELIAEAGFHDIEVVRAQLELVFQGGVEAILRSMQGSPYAVEIGALSGEVYERFRQAATTNLQPFLDAEGNMRSPSTTWLARAVKYGGTPSSLLPFSP